MCLKTKGHMVGYRKGKTQVMQQNACHGNHNAFNLNEFRL